ncbi:homeobox protein knotted-1-like 7 [Selaginella moellendorffii]|uniref:homeobox protein knotted-1-like 7 n=1 Tax=Selaginella moellendorffii TaxID=88036 RepID=UPI000D1D1216|nr:homeobox protein knotted-1-like 7 [Selaginella moellendorffii]|eukprot:XP_024522124.1 homeobox protein knotted-1-like 7 [Selaginella moellendorffii]
MGSSSQSGDEAAAADSSKQQQQQMGMPTWLNSALSRQTSSQQQAQDQQQQAWPNPSSSSYTNWLSAAGATSTGVRRLEQQQASATTNTSPATATTTTTTELLVEQDRKAAVAAAAMLMGAVEADVTSHGSVPGDPDLDECAAARYQMNAGLKADIVTHPLYEQLLEAHVACLRIATPVDQLSRIDGQISQCHHAIAKYSILANHQLLCGSSKEELDHFMAHYVMLLKSFKDQLQHHVRVHAKEAVMACWELEQSLISLTGAAPGEGTGATMSDDEDEQQQPQQEQQQQQQSDSDYWQDNLGFGPLIPTETERTLMERVRQELKHELKQGYRARIVDVREEILRKRRAGKLPGDTTSVLKAWWHAHSKWPYPTEDEKARLVQETGLELKQINNWFINQRKRNWHHHPSSSTNSSTKAKCKR